METRALNEAEDYKPRIVTRQSLVAGVADRYRRQYPTNREIANGQSGDVLSRLEALPENATPEDVAEIIGNDTWTALECDICELDRDAVVSVPRRYETSPALLCRSCARGALELFTEQDK